MRPGSDPLNDKHRHKSLEGNDLEEMILQANKISKRFGGVQALAGCDLICYKGEVHALIGENGAGKSTLIKILCGVERQDEGEIIYKGEKIDIKSPSDAASRGIVPVFQELSLIRDLSVAENIYLACEPKKNGLIDFKKMARDAQEVLDSLNFNIDSRALVRQLSLAEQQLVEIAKAVSKDPEVLIMDEATSALGQEQVENLFAIIRRLAQNGKSIIFISHKMNELAEIANRATIYRDAHYVVSFRWGEYSNDEIISAIAGRKIESSFPEKRDVSKNEVVLKTEHLCYKNLLKDVSVSVRKGEIFGLAGLNGHGQVEFLNALFGAERLDKGTITFKNKNIRVRSPKSALRQGIAMTPADRKNDGLLLTRSIRENISLMVLDKISRLGIIEPVKENKGIDEMTELMKIKMDRPEQATGTLSGGNQQKIVLGKAILTHSDILLLADPTRGIDVGTKTEFYQLIHRLADLGITILLYSTEYTELLGLCNRVAVFKAGEIVAVLEGETLTEREILKASLGIQEESEA